MAFYSENHEKNINNLCGHKSRDVHCWYIEFEVPTAVVVKSTLFWDILVTLSSPLKVNQRFG